MTKEERKKYCLILTLPFSTKAPTRFLVEAQLEFLCTPHLLIQPQSILPID